MKNERTGKKTGPFRCLRCGSPSWGNLQFCAGCGLFLNNECQGCGATWRYYHEYAFCPSGGARLKKIIY
ncbi:MAG: hypothetical protein WBC02_03740 [Candidatus Aminicenantaceae bacterium]